MAIIVEIQVHYRIPGVAGKSEDVTEVLTQPPSGQDTGSIKLDVGRMVEQIRKEGKAEYWYMVVKVRKTDGKFAYRTMIPKTLF